jgi:hypothetical protein
MKSMIAAAMFSVAGLLLTASASAQTPQAHYQTVQASVPPVPVMTVCYVNGVNYPVDYSYRIWGTNAAGVWVVIGKINMTPNGPVAVGLGQAYPAACQ